MRESRRVELGGRVLAVALSDDGTYTAACVRGKRGGLVYVWETAKPAKALAPIHTQLGDFGSAPYASLAFAPDGKHLAGCVIDRQWLRRPPGNRLSGQVQVWELAPEPGAQRAPRHLYTRPLPGGDSCPVIVDNSTFLTAGAKEGAVDFHDIRDGRTQFRLVLGKFTIGAMRVSSDRKWLALEQHPVTTNGGGATASEIVEVGVYAWPLMHKATVPCSRLLDIASGGQVVAVVRGRRIELWDAATATRRKAAPFEYTRIDAVRFSPDGKLLAVSDRNDLVLWRWQRNTHERVALGRRVGSLAFTPDGRFLAEGPTPGEDIRVRDMETRRVVQTLPAGTRRAMNVVGIAYTQGGRVLIGCANLTPGKGNAGPHQIILWDTAAGSVAHRIALPADVPTGIDVSPTGRYLAVVLDEGHSGRRLRVWALDGAKPVTEPVQVPPATAGPR